MGKRWLGLALFFIFIGVALGGCACNQTKLQEEAMAQQAPPAVVQQAPYRAPAVVPVPPPKKDRN